MSYQTVAQLTQDYLFLQRVEAVTQEQALVFRNDGRPEISSLAIRLIADSGMAVSWFRWPIALSPGFGDKFEQGGQESITDADLLAATQVAWFTVAAAHAD